MKLLLDTIVLLWWLAGAGRMASAEAPDNRPIPARNAFPWGPTVTNDGGFE